MLRSARFFLRLALILVAVAAAAQVAAPDQPAHAASASLQFPSASCSGGSANVTFSWQPLAGASQTWLDISDVDNNFAPGSFNSVPVGGASSYTWPALKSGTPYVWRINSLTSAGWQPSEVAALTPCGSPTVLSTVTKCGNAGDANLRVRWAPSSPAARVQYLDAATDPALTNGLSSGALSAGADNFELTGIAANAPVYYRVNSQMSDGSWRSSVTRSIIPRCLTNLDTDLHATGDTFVFRRMGIAAPVNVRRVGPDGALENPAGRDDVVRYDFTGLYGLGGSPGGGGTTVLAGHLDFLPNFQAVFWGLDKARKGDLLEYYRADGMRVPYTVAWIGVLPSDETLNQYLQSTNPETMVLITCGGDFNATTRNYSDRIIVYAVASDG
jgi:LPXTG-site transpeptidase (sortase) family protein